MSDQGLDLTHLVPGILLVRGEHFKNFLGGGGPDGPAKNFSAGSFGRGEIS